MKKIARFKKRRGIKPFMTVFLITVYTQFVWSQEIKKSIQVESNHTIEDMVSMIQTEVDSNFVYDYKKTKFVPPSGKTLLIMGQSVERINEYLNHFPYQERPSGWSAYCSVADFKGVTVSYESEDGYSQNQQMLIDRFPNTVLLSGMWMAGTRDVAKKAGNGDYDEIIKQYATWAKTTNRPIYLRIGYEFDAPHNKLKPKEYVKAYRRIVDLIRANGANNIAFVWHSYAYKTYKGYPLSDWYPGDDYVDWVGISAFYMPYHGSVPSPECDAVLEFAKQHKKPVMIAESSPVKGIEEENLKAWNWFKNFFTFAYNKNIKAISFINQDWTTWNVIAGLEDWRDARLYNNEKISKAWFLETNKTHYLKQSPELYELIGYNRKIKNE